MLHTNKCAQRSSTTKSSNAWFLYFVFLSCQHDTTGNRWTAHKSVSGDVTFRKTGAGTSGCRSISQRCAVLSSGTCWTNPHNHCLFQEAFDTLCRLIPDHRYGWRSSLSLPFIELSFSLIVENYRKRWVNEKKIFLACPAKLNFV